MTDYRSAVCVLLVDQRQDPEQFLSVSLKTDLTDFNLPGGKVEPGETLPQAAVRELQEETGIKVDPHHLSWLHQGIDQDYQVTTFLATEWTGTIQTEEIGVVRWLPLIKLKASRRWPKYNSRVHQQYLLQRQ